jgi:hypothetical protein
MISSIACLRSRKMQRESHYFVLRATRENLALTSGIGKGGVARAMRLVAGAGSPARFPPSQTVSPKTLRVRGPGRAATMLEVSPKGDQTQGSVPSSDKDVSLLRLSRLSSRRWVRAPGRCPRV